MAGSHASVIGAHCGKRKATRARTTEPGVSLPAGQTGAANMFSDLTPVKRSELRERLIARKVRSDEAAGVDMTVFERLPENLLRQQAELGVEAAERELARRIGRTHR